MGREVVLSPAEETSILIEGNFEDNVYSKNLKVISKIEIKTTQDNSLPKLFVGQYSDWHNGYFIAVCKKT